MRMRKKKHYDLRIEKCKDLFLTEITDFYKYTTGQTVELEIGCGKGKFISETAKNNPDKKYIAIEKIPDVMLLAMERIKKENIENIRFILCDAFDILKYIPENSIEIIYLNFNDPWPKSGHYKRRLTYRGFLEMYKKILITNGRIKLKTDNVPYFDFSVSEISSNGFRILHHTYDLHGENIYNTILTEYETNFLEKGFKICYLEAELSDTKDTAEIKTEVDI